MTIKNNVTRLLDSRKIDYTAHEYDSSQFHSADEVAQLIGVPVEHIYKTIVVLREDAHAGRKPLLVMVAGNREIDLRKLAAALGEKRSKSPGTTRPKP